VLHEVVQPGMQPVPLEFFLKPGLQVKPQLPLQVLVPFTGGAQQSLLDPQEMPIVAQAPQVPFDRHWRPLQHSAPVEQLPPLWLQVPQWPAMQSSPLQH
jgi:hypothetical protein